MKAFKQIPELAMAIILLLILGSCGMATPVPPLPLTLFPSHAPTPSPSITPSPFPTTASTPDFCSSTLWQDQIQILFSDRFTALEPGGPRVFDRSLAEKNPAWTTFRQSVHGEIRSAGVIFHEIAFGPEPGTGVNPAVLLVTYGVERNWKLPENGDLFSEVDHIRAALHQHELGWILGTVGHDQYPMITNGATYALYRYFDEDRTKLEKWCRTWVEVYGESPLK
jgi:hypothetical protein